MEIESLYKEQQELQEKAKILSLPKPTERNTPKNEAEPSGAAKPEKGVEDIYADVTGYTFLSEYTDKSIEEIMKSGTIKERAALFLADTEAMEFGDKARILTMLQRDILLVRAGETEEGYMEFLNYCGEFDSLSKYEKKLRPTYNAIQADEAELVLLLNKWLDLLISAEISTDIWRKVKGDSTLSFFDKEEFLSVLTREVWEEGNFIFESESDTIKVSIDGELYGRILSRAKRVECSLSMFKAGVSAIVDYIREKGEENLIVPYGLEAIIRENYKEVYVRSILTSDKFLRSEFLRRKSAGETITEEEEQMAVFPCFYEIEEDAGMREIYDSIIAKFPDYTKRYMERFLYKESDK